MWMWWLAVALIVGVVEMLTVDFIFLMFVGGALAAVIAALLGAPIYVQVIVFAVVSVALLFLVRPHVRAWVARTTPGILTNAQALVGADARVVMEVTSVGGRVKLRGEVWSARPSIPDDVIPVGVDVVVTEIDGAIAVVTRPQPTY